MAVDPGQTPTKRLIVACDGTWQNSDNGFTRDSWLPWNTNGHLADPSNVARICRAIRPESTDGIQQIIYYQAGVGTSGGSLEKIWGAVAGEGLSENIREAYGFLVNNYDRGDEIFLLGFSRGAFTARSIAGMINCVGLLTARGMDDFYPIFKDWENQVNPHYVSKWPERPFSNRPNITDVGYAQELESLGLSRLNITIRAIGVWDTVGALGVPSIGLLPPVHREYFFVNNRVGTNVEYAFQALALDEHRKLFAPTLWEMSEGPSSLKVLKQCWFPGVHSNIGGSYPDASLSNITLTWLISQLSPLLSFNTGYLTHLYDLSDAFYSPAPRRPYSTGLIYNSSSGITALAGSTRRTPGSYHASVSATGKPLRHQLLKGTHETIHASVRLRIELGGKGIRDKGKYKPKALKGWKVLGYPGTYRWVNSEAEGATVLAEEVLADLELALLKRSPEAVRFYGCAAAAGLKDGIGPLGEKA